MKGSPHPHAKQWKVLKPWTFFKASWQNRTTMGSAVDKPCFKPWLPDLQANSFFTSLNPICSVGIVLTLTLGNWEKSKNGWHTVGPQCILACFFLPTLHSYSLPSPCHSLE